MASLRFRRKKIHGVQLIKIIGLSLTLALLLATSLPFQVLAAGNATTVGTLSLTPTIENIGLISSFSDDDNGNNSAVLEYREVGSSTWKPGIMM